MFITIVSAKLKQDRTQCGTIVDSSTFLTIHGHVVTLTFDL